MSKVITQDQVFWRVLLTGTPVIVLGMVLEKYHPKSLLFIWCCYLIGLLIVTFTLTYLGYEVEDCSSSQEIQIPKPGYYKDENGKIFQLSFEKGPKISDGTHIFYPKRWQYTRYGLNVSEGKYCFPGPETEVYLQDDCNMTYIQDQRSVEWYTNRGFLINRD